MPGKVNEGKVEVYILLRCPQCKRLVEKYPPGKYDAVSNKDIFRCVDCGVDYMIEFRSLTRVDEQRNAPVQSEQKCPSCAGTGSIPVNVVLKTKCPACSGTGISNRSDGG